MGERTGIQWTQHTWNPWQGCQKVSPGCTHCFMFRDKKRYGQNPLVVVRSKPPTFNAPRRWNREAEARGERALVFVASWADFFSREADEWRDDAWAVIRECPWLTFQELTKRHARIASHLPADWGDGYPNVWLGVSAENREWWDRRVESLREVPARVRFVSLEPQLDSIEGASAVGIDWVVVGGESGPRDPSHPEAARPFHLRWAREAIEICRRDGSAPFIKQLGSCAMSGGETYGTNDSHGGDWSEWPPDLRVREMPAVHVLEEIDGDVPA